MSLWDTFKDGAQKAGAATKIAALKAKCNADLLLLDREIENTKKNFGIQLYDHISPLAQSADFYAASDQLTEMIRGPLLKAQKEVQALACKRVTLKQIQAEQQVKRAASFPTKAETFGDKLKNAGKSTLLAGPETKTKTELAMLDMQIKHFKQQFGLELYFVFVNAEDTTGYLPPDRTVRSIYDQTRSDIAKLEQNKVAKRNELQELSNQAQGIFSSDGNTTTGREEQHVASHNSNPYSQPQVQVQQQQQYSSSANSMYSTPTNANNNNSTPAIINPMFATPQSQQYYTTPSPQPQQTTTQPYQHTSTPFPNNNNNNNNQNTEEAQDFLL